MSDATPRLRQEIDVHPIQHEGQTLFVLYDTSGVSHAQLAVSPSVVFIATQLDGSSSILDIQDRFARESGGQILPSSEIQSVIQALDEALFLQGERFVGVLSEMRAAFATQDVRAATSAGTAYSQDPALLRQSLGDMLHAAPPPEEPAAHAPAQAGPPRGMIIPHIDFVRGAAGYGQAYRELAQVPPPETVVILGTSHHPMTNRIALCDKDFAVPGGVVGNARACTERLREACRGTADLLADLFAHQGEHSVELQAVWLRHVWGERFRIVPVLVGSMHEFLDAETGPARALEDAQLQAFVAALQSMVAEGPGVMLLASADLSHVGPRFGDARALSTEYLEEVETADRDYLAAIASGVPRGGLACLQRYQDRYHVCGAGCIHILNAVLAGVPGRLLGYHQAATPEMQQAVTFASMIFS